MATQTGTRPTACHWRDTAAADRALSAMLGDGRSRAALSSPDHTRLWNALEDASIGGKRFRPALVRAAHDTFDGTEHEASLADLGVIDHPTVRLPLVESDDAELARVRDGLAAVGLR